MEPAARDIAQILARRARKLAQSSESAQPATTEALATFTISGHRIGVPLANMVQAAGLRRLTEIPTGPPHLLGMMAVHGHLVSLLHLGIFLGLERRGIYDITGVLVVTSGSREIGLGAEAILGVEDVPSELIATLPGHPGPLGQVARFDAADRGELLLLDVRALFADPRLGPPHG